MSQIERKFATILATDCVSFSKHMTENEEGTLSSLNSCRSIIDQYIEQHGGRIFHTAGDSVLAEFNSPIETVNCAINFQDRIYERNDILTETGGDRPLFWRVGIHCDEVILENDNVYGNGVNIAARLEAQCSPGQILVSRAINEQVVSRIEAIFQAAGKKKLKNISDAFEVFSICTEKTTNLGGPSKPSETPLELKNKKPMVAILPFKNLNANEDSAFLIDGIFEDILTELSMVRQVSVVSRQSSMNFTESGANLDQFISQFNVNFLIQGSIRSAGPRVRITVSLVDADTQEVIWSKKFDRTLDDIFEVQDEIVRSVIKEILGEIELASLSRAKRKPTENMSSYEFLLKGKEGHHTLTAEANANAIKMFDAAIEADPENAQAYAWKACTLGQAMVKGYVDKPMQEIMPEFSNLMSSALSIDPNDFECHRLQCAVNTMMGDMKAALEHGKKAYDVNPNDPRILQQYGEVLLKTGKTEEGCDLTLLALEYDPIAQGQTNSDKRKSDGVFGCVLDDRPDIGLDIASGMIDRSEKVLVYSAALAVGSAGSLKNFSWLTDDLKNSDFKQIEAAIEEMGKFDVVVQSKLKEVFLDHILPLREAA
jgi:adenylate cyclase